MAQPNLFDVLKPSEDKRKNQAPKNQKIGKEFEKEIIKSCKLYQELKIAYIQKFFQEAFWVNKGMGGFMAYRDGGAGFDFIGGIVETKSPIFMECKSTAESHLEIGQEKTGLKIHQVKDMFMLEELGFEVYLLWQLRKAEIVYKITPKQILNLIGETKRLNIMNCQENHTPIIVKVKHENNWYYDFLNKLE